MARSPASRRGVLQLVVSASEPGQCLRVNPSLCTSALRLGVALPLLCRLCVPPTVSTATSRRGVLFSPATQTSVIMSCSNACCFGLRTWKPGRPDCHYNKVIFCLCWSFCQPPSGCDAAPVTRASSPGHYSIWRVPFCKPPPPPQNYNVFLLSNDKQIYAGIVLSSHVLCAGSIVGVQMDL